MTAKTMDKVTGEEESRGSTWELSVNDPFVKKVRSRIAMRNAYQAKLQQIRDSIPGLKDEAHITKFEPRPFGDDLGAWKISASEFKCSVVSIALFHDEVMVFACSGTALRLLHDYIQDTHIIFVTSARLAHEFNANRTKDDKLKVKVRTADNRTMHGYLGLHDNNIAIVTSFAHHSLYAIDMCNPVDLPRGTRSSKLFAFGCADDCTLMGISCSHPVFQKDGLVSVDCNGVTETGLGGPVICFGHGGSGHFAGVIVGYCVGKNTFIPTKMLHELLQGFQITSKTSHFRGYSLPKGVKSVVPSGFLVRSKIHQSLGYPMPPPLVFELNGGLAGTFEEEFGQLHFSEGYPFDYPYLGCGKPIWEQLGKAVTEKMCKSVVSIASFKEDVRHFACTGLLITSSGNTFVLTSASLVRTGDAQDEIDESLRFQVFLPPGQCVDGRLELYHPNYNIAIVSLEKDLGDVSPQDMLNARAPCPNKVVAAIGRGPKDDHGLLMASMGKVKCTTNRHPTKKEQQGLNLNCKDLVLSTCKIKKVGIGGPLISLNGKFMGMNFYNEGQTTPFLPSKKIVTVLKRGFKLLSERDSISRPVNMDQPRKSKERNRWPVSKPYWYLAGCGDALNQLRGKVLT